MKLLITKNNGELWSCHEIDADTARHLEKRLRDAIPNFSREPRDIAYDELGNDKGQELLDDLDNALKQTIDETFD